MPWPPASTVSHLLESNLPPSEIEVDLILNILSRADSDLSSIRKRIQSRPKRRVLKTQLRAYEIYLIRHQSTLSPLRRLPPELLYQIFEFFAPPQPPLDEPYGGGHWSESPWGISQVCHRWRSIALSMPRLWIRIPYLALRAKYVTSPSFLEFFTGFLLRSANMPISIFVCWSDCEHEDKAEKRHPAIKVLVSHSHRWQHLSITSSEPSAYLLRAFRPIKNRLPILRTLHLNLHPEACLDMFHKAPKLSQVQLAGISPERIALPWKQLVHYKGKHEEMSLPKILHSSPLLETLELDGNYDDDFSEPDDLPIVLCNLVGLTLYGGISEDFATFLLQRLVAPAIEDITIYCGLRTSFIPPLTSMIRRSPNGSVLQMLSLDANRIPGELISLLRLTPRLISLNITYPTNDDLLRIANMGSVGEPNPIVPLLQNLVINDEEDSDMDPTKATIIKTVARIRCEEANRLLIELDSPNLVSSPPHYPSPILPLRTFCSNLFTGSMFEVQAILNGWNQYPSADLDSELTLFCDWSSELGKLFPRLLPNEFHPSENFVQLVAPLTTAQKLMMFTQVMINHKLREVKNLFKSRLLVYIGHLSHNRMSDTLGRDREDIAHNTLIILKRWRHQASKGFRDHHRWVAGSHSSLFYIPTYEFSLWTPKAMMEAIIYGTDKEIEEARERSDLPPLPMI